MVNKKRFIAYKVTPQSGNNPNILLFFLKKIPSRRVALRGVFGFNRAGRLAVVLLHDLDEVEHLVAVTNLVVVPGNHLDELVGQVNTCVGVEDGGQGATQEVAADNLVLGVTQNTLELTLAGLLHGSADVLLGGGVLQVNGEVNNRYVEGRNAHRDTGQLAVELGDYLAHSLGSASRAGDDVAASGTTAAPILCTGDVNGALGSGYRVNGGHQTALNTEAVVQDLGDGSQAVGGAAGVATLAMGAKQLVVQLALLTMVWPAYLSVFTPQTNISA